jgi:hypothetical protein
MYKLGTTPRKSSRVISSAEEGLVGSDSELDDRVAKLVLQLKRQFQHVLMACPEYSSDACIAREMDTLGNLIKELEDTVVIERVRAAPES